jgi:RNA polymerase sigma-70 factor (ECF subfamily)
MELFSSTAINNQTPAPAQDAALPRGNGNPDAFLEALREHESRVYSIALRITGRRSDAEELTQDAFLQLHSALERMADRQHLKRWLLRAISHLCLNHLRDERRRPRLVSIDTMPPDCEPPTPETGSDPMLTARLHRLLLDLSTEARAVVLLRFQEDLDPLEIADVLDMSVNTVKSHLRRSIDWMRAQCAGEHHGL